MVVKKSDLGTIVNEIQVDKEAEELQSKIKELELSRINIRVSAVLFDKLNRIAEFKGMSIEEYAAEVLKDSTEEKIGQPVISGPSKINGGAARKITGPTIKIGGPS